jgi:plastocyanin
MTLLPTRWMPTRLIPMRLKRGSAILPVAFGLLLAACGGGESDTGSADTAGSDEPIIIVKSLDSLQFDPTTVSAPAGKVRIEHINEGSIVHTFVLEGQDFRLVDDDDKLIDLTEGEYTFFCDVPGHREGGMEGTLTVTP